ncbi:MAG TPA: hypothetical protein VNN08_18980 [Thermoanaerobaculia bacterium]|nr:hypothetical protein [Thermoanaerobaculia bacterium]
MRIASGILIALAAAGCASHSANERPEPNVVELWSVPTHSSVNLDCGAGTIAKGITPLRVDVPRYPEICTIEVLADGYRPLRMRFDRGLVLREGLPLREDEHHQLDQSASTLDMVLFPLQNLGDRIQNAAMHKLRADYRLELKLVPLPR